MPLAQGKIEAISVKMMPQADQFDNTHRVNFLMGAGEQETWYSLGSSKGGAYANKDIPELHRGDVVEFMYDINGDFKNVKRATMTLTQAAAVTTTGSITGAVVSKIGGSPNPAEVGQAMNLAVQLNPDVKQYSDFNNQDIIRGAIIDYRNLKKQFTDLWDVALNEPQPGVNDSFDDDIPF